MHAFRISAERIKPIEILIIFEDFVNQECECCSAEMYCMESADIKLYYCMVCALLYTLFSFNLDMELQFNVHHLQYCNSYRQETLITLICYSAQLCPTRIVQ